MATLQDGAKLAYFYNGNLLEWITSLDISTDSGQNKIDLLNQGLGGFTPGSGLVTISVGFAVPIGGTEDDFQQDCANGTYVTSQVVCGKKSYIGRGKLMSCKISQSVNGSTEGSFEWTGELKPFE
jgi:hypothetical protein